MPRVLVISLALGVMAACSAPPPDDGELSSFVEGEPIHGRVIENVTDCRVDAACYLELRFSDRSVIAYYGTGERPAPPCPISVEVSNASFPLQPGDVVEVTVRDCPGEGYFLERVIPDTPGADAG